MSKRSRLGPIRIGLVVVSAIVLVVALIWWQDRELVTAEKMLEGGAPVAAENVLERFLARRPGHQRALVLKARTLVALQQWGPASELFSRTGARSPAELHAWATALLHQQQWNDALPLLEQVIATGGDEATVLRDLTVCRFQLGHIDAALENATQLSSLPGHALDGFFQRGVMQGSLGNSNLAIENWEQIEKLSRDATGLPIPPAEFFRVFAEDLMLEGRPRQALDYLQRSVALLESGEPISPQSKIEIQTQLGQAWLQAGNESNATSVWTEVLQTDENNQVARIGLAKLALSRADAEEALRWLAPISPEQGATPAVAYLMQRAYTLLKNEEQAEQWQQRVAVLQKSEKLQAAFEGRAN